MRTLLALLTILIVGITGTSQTIRGVVSDENELPMVSVTVMNIDNGKHAHTDRKGKFELKDVQVGDSLKFTFMGFETVILMVTDFEEEVLVKLSPDVFTLGEIVIEPREDALNSMTDLDIQLDPVISSQEILRKVPGLFIGQHAGGGKAEQIFLRGFDIDHGTDITLSVDGLPVNMVSHAHGQGYADLHFLIPEVLDNIDFGKGPYTAQHGNFNTAGYVNFNTKNSLAQSQVKIEAGQFGTRRLFGGVNVLRSLNHNAFVAVESLQFDGPTESPQDLNRANFFGKYSGKVSENKRLSLIMSAFTSQWNASGQIPQRAVDQGLITRFGSIDDTEGGKTERKNIVLTLDQYLSDRAFLRNRFFYSNYDFELFSNFTFFLNDSIHGDQIKQRESRDMYGFQSEFNQEFNVGESSGVLKAGLSLRNDHVSNNELSHTLNRQEVLEYKQLGDVFESNWGAFVAATFNYGRFTLNTGLRGDYFDFQYDDALLSSFTSQSDQRAILSPKLSLLFSQSESLQWYVKAGKGFHSNDTRVVVEKQGREILPDATSADLGFIWKPVPRVMMNLAYWNLFLEQEFVYVGDEGIVEPSGETTRQGLEFSLRAQPMDWLYWNFDANYTYARSADEAATYIPLAPEFTLVSGLNAVHTSGVFGGADIRHLRNRPANEDNSIVAEGYTIVDMNLGYDCHHYSIGVQIQNLLNTEWNETQFATESRLQHEMEPIEEIHFTPGTPFFAKISLSYKF